MAENVARALSGLINSLEARTLPSLTVNDQRPTTND